MSKVKFKDMKEQPLEPPEEREDVEPNPDDVRDYRRDMAEERKRNAREQGNGETSTF